MTRCVVLPVLCGIFCLVIVSNNASDGRVRIEVSIRHLLCAVYHVEMLLLLLLQVRSDDGLLLVVVRAVHWGDVHVGGIKVVCQLLCDILCHCWRMKR